MPCRRADDTPNLCQIRASKCPSRAPEGHLLTRIFGDLEPSDLVQRTRSLWNQPERLLLVPTDRPANVPKWLGWLGATNSGYVGERLATVFRSWEDRYGATVLQLGFDTAILRVPRIPADAENDLRLEHWGFWWD